MAASSDRPSFPAAAADRGREDRQRQRTADDQTQLTTWYTERAVKFIEKNKERPFFLYVAHNMPHVPLFVSDKFKGKSQRGLYGDVIMEIDWSVGQILDTLKRLELDEQHAGDLHLATTARGSPTATMRARALPLREGKGTMFDGGCRVPCIMRWPGKHPRRHDLQRAGRHDRHPADHRRADRRGAAQAAESTAATSGRCMEGQPGAKTPHEVYYFYWGRELQAVRSGPWKLHFPHSYRRSTRPANDGKPGPYGKRRPGWNSSTWRTTSKSGTTWPTASRRGRAAEGPGRKGPRGPRRLGHQPARQGRGEVGKLRQ